MRIYNRVVLEMATGRIVEEDYSEYSGPVAMLKGGGKSAPPPPEPPPEDNSDEIEAAALEARRLARRRSGRSSTILTSGLGAATTPGQKKQLFGA